MALLELYGEAVVDEESLEAAAPEVEVDAVVEPFFNSLHLHC